MENISKKEFKECSHIAVYGTGKNRRVRLYYGYKREGNIAGYKYVLVGYGCTQAMILADGYDILIKDIKDALCWYDLVEAKTDAERMKVRISG